MNTMVLLHEGCNALLHGYAPVKVYNGSLLNLVGFKILKISYSVSNYPIDLPFTKGVVWVIRGLYTKYLNNWNIFINYIFLEILWYTCILWPCTGMVQLNFFRNVNFKDKTKSLLCWNYWKFWSGLQEV